MLRVGLFGGEPCLPGLKAEIEPRNIVCTDNTPDRGHGAGRRASAWSAICSISPRTTSSGRSSIPRRASPARRRDGRARAHAAGKAGHPGAAHRTHDLTRGLGAPAVAPRPACRRCAPARRHAHHPRHERVPRRCGVLAGIDGVTPHYRIVVEMQAA
ncbi:MAG: hypothetical protein ACLSVD_08045 [Eggerthellaceae bacterium]